MAAAAHRQGKALYLVGGAVRDLCLGRIPGDLDAMVEGDSFSIARDMECRGIEVRLHPRFGTTVFRHRSGARLDLVSARSEVYQEPSSLPVVRPDSLQADLWRRDFSVNAMALEVRPSGLGPLLDPCGGQQDLRRRRIRVLHSRSFRDDPTRAFRGVRLGVRLGFRLAHDTEVLLRAAIRAQWFDRLSPSRLGREIRRLAAEKQVHRILESLDDLGLLAAIHPALSLPPGQRAAARRLAGCLARAPDPERLRLLVAFLGWGQAEASWSQALQRLELPAGECRRARSIRTEARRLLQALPAAPFARPSLDALDALSRPVRRETLDLAACVAPSFRHRRWLRSIRRSVPVCPPALPISRP